MAKEKHNLKRDNKGRFVKGNYSPYWAGRKFTDKHKKKISNSLKGDKSYWYGKNVKRFVRKIK